MACRPPPQHCQKFNDQSVVSSIFSRAASISCHYRSHAQSSTMISKRAAARFAFVALLALVVGTGIYIVTRHQSPVMVSSKTASFTLTADELFSEYKANEVAADDKY